MKYPDVQRSMLSTSTFASVQKMTLLLPTIGVVRLARQTTLFHLTSRSTYMKVSKFLISSAVAAAVIGGIGFSFAQSGDNAVNSKGTPGSPTMQNPSSTTVQSTPSGMQNPQTDRSTGSMNRDTTGTMNRDATGTMSNERVARADRN
jgi:hypothetical protein